MRQRERLERLKIFECSNLRCITNYSCIVRWRETVWWATRLARRLPNKRLYHTTCLTDRQWEGAGVSWPRLIADGVVSGGRWRRLQTCLLHALCHSSCQNRNTDTHLLSGLGAPSVPSDVCSSL